jgi:hypothetical protein
MGVRECGSKGVPERPYVNTARPDQTVGFSQLFLLLDRPMQDHIIARTKHRK